MVFNEFISNYGATIIYTILTAIAGYIGIAVKKLYTKFVNDKTKKDVVNTCVKAVEQIYKDLHGEEKLAMCIQSVTEMLSEKGIHITEIEIRMLIEAAVNELNQGIDSIQLLDTLDFEDEDED